MQEFTHDGRSRRGRLLFWVAVALLAAGAWRASASGTSLWSFERRGGGVAALAWVDGRPAVAAPYADRVRLVAPDGILNLPFARPLRVVADSPGGAYVLGINQDRVGHVDANGQVAPDLVWRRGRRIGGLAVAPEGLLLAGYRARAEDAQRKVVKFMPEYRRFGCFAQWLMRPNGLGEADELRDPWRYAVETMHEEGTGRWIVLLDRDRVFVVNDQAETITCLDRVTGGLLWRHDTPPRPTGAVRLGGLVLLVSGQGGLIEARRVRSGGLAWRLPIDRGVTDMVARGKKAVLTDWRGDRLLVLDPLKERVEREIPLAGAPRAAVVSPDGDLWVGLAAANQIVRLDRDWRVVERRVLDTEGEGS